MDTHDNYQGSANREVAAFLLRDAGKRHLLVNAVKDRKVQRLLDVGCGAGQEMLPFLEKTDAFCIGVDIADEIAETAEGFFQNLRVEDRREMENRISFVRSAGEELPFADESFDVVLCRVSLPYMRNRETIAEIARVLVPGGVLFLKIHSPVFYLGMIWRRWRKFSLKQIAYPVICLTGGTFHFFTGKQPKGVFWKGKEVYQTTGMLNREFNKYEMNITSYLSDTSIEAPSMVVERNK